MIDFSEISKSAIVHCNKLEEEIAYHSQYIEVLLEVIKTLSDELSVYENEDYI